MLREGDAGDPGEDLQGAAPSGTGLAGGDPSQDAPGALTERILLTGAPSTAPAAPSADLPSPAPPSPWGQPAPSSPSLPDFGDEPPSHPPTEVEDGEGGRVASAAFAEEEAEARAALAEEELEVAAQVPVPEEAGSGMASGASAGWLGGPDPDAGSLDRSDRLPVSPGAHPGPGTPEEVYKGIKQEPKEGE